MVYLVEVSSTITFIPSYFGEHITLDGYGGDPQRLNEKEKVSSALSGLCDALHMHPLMEAPMVVSGPDNHLKDPGGWSGFLMIAESHISIHTFPRRRFISADIYSCQTGIDQALIVSFLTDAFCLEDVETHFIKRGLKYPEHNVV